MDVTIEHELLEVGASPIAGDSPCGVNVKYEASYEELEAELAKQESLSAETVDWDKVRQLSTGIIQNQSKDMLVACYLAYSLGLAEGYKGLYVGFKIINDMTETFWADMFPPAKRLRARQSAMNWLVEKVALYLTEKPPAANEAEVVIALAKLVKDVDFALADKMENQAPLMTDITRPLKSLKQSMEVDLKAQEQAAAPVAAPAAAEPAAQEAPVTEAPAPAPAAAPAPPPVPAPAPAPAAAPASSSGGGVAAVGDITSDSEAKRAERQVQDGLRKLATWHAQKKDSDAKRFRMTRFALWMAIDSLPPNTDGKTQVPAPPADKMKKFQALFDQGEFNNVLESIEKAAAKLPYWFDAQRLQVMALDALGGQYQKARSALVAELAGFLKRLPQIVDFSYSDGTPFCSEQTKLWINTEVLAAEGGSDQGGSGEGDALFTETRAESRKLAASGKLGEAIALVREGMQQAATPRSQYQYRVVLAGLLLESGKVDVAVSLLERITSEIKGMLLTEWDPEIAADVYRLLVNGYEKQAEENEGELSERYTSAFEELCWHDPGAAVDLQ